MFVIVRDETPGGRSLAEVTLELPGPGTLGELIRHRVREEVARHNLAPSHDFRGLVQPRKRDPGRRIDWEEQADVALQAFRQNGFFVLVGDRQVDDLDAELDLSTASDVAFVRLVPLVGG